MINLTRTPLMTSEGCSFSKSRYTQMLQNSIYIFMKLKLGSSNIPWEAAFRWSKNWSWSFELGTLCSKNMTNIWLNPQKSDLNDLNSNDFCDPIYFLSPPPPAPSLFPWAAAVLASLWYFIYTSHVLYVGSLYLLPPRSHRASSFYPGLLKYHLCMKDFVTLQSVVVLKPLYALTPLYSLDAC